MNDRVLFVDDEPNVLKAIERQLRKEFSVFSSLSGQQALELMKKSRPFAVIVSDMRMPEMNGVQLLARVKEIAPETVRMMLTGNADQETAIQAVNEGNIFRFLNKPCPPHILKSAVYAAVEQYRLVTAEKELLNQTLNGSIRVMTEILSQVSPAAFSRAYRIKGYVSQIVAELRLPNRWEFQIAALLSQLGCVTLPTDLVEKVYSGVDLDEEEQKMFNSHPYVGAKLLANISRFENISRIIELQQMRFDEYKGRPRSPNDRIVRIGAQILKAALDFDQMLFLGYDPDTAYKKLGSRQGAYNPNILKVLANIKTGIRKYKVQKVYLKELTLNMVLNQDIVAKNGLLLASKGQEITYSLRERLFNFAKTIGIYEPIEVQQTA